MNKGAARPTGRLYRKYVLRDFVYGARVVECPQCGLRLKTHPVVQGSQCDCPRCGRVIVRNELRPLAGVVSYALAALIVFVFAATEPFMSLHMLGVEQTVSLWSMVLGSIGWGRYFFAATLFALVFAAPLAYLFAVLYVYGCIFLRAFRPRALAMTRLVTAMGPWVMTDIFFFAGIVTVVKVSAMGSVTFHLSFYAMLIFSALLLRVMVGFNEFWVYDRFARIKGQDIRARFAGEGDMLCPGCMHIQRRGALRCAFCRSRLGDDRRRLVLSWAFLITGILLYVPANYLPIMISSNPMATEVNAIFDGIVFMWQAGDRAIAAVIFIASIFIPFFKIGSLLFLLYCCHSRIAINPVAAARLYRFIEWIGKWSMIDVFVIALLSNLFQSNLARVVPGPAAPYFTLVVISTMLAVHFFDTRWLWQTAKGRSGAFLPNFERQGGGAEASARTRARA